MKKLILAFMLILLLSVPSFADNTVTTSDNGVTVTNIDSDYNPGSYVTIWSIKFYPSATTDYVTIKFTDASGQMFTKLMNTAGTDPVIEYFPPKFRVRPFFDYSESSIDTAADATIVIIYRKQ
jgi:hypothetical protein